MSRSPAILTLPNLLTLSRFPLAAAIVLVRGPETQIGLIGLASLTDLLDGWIARHGGRATIMGALLDPVADKVFVLAALCAFLAAGDLSVGTYAVLLMRDVAVAIGFLVAYLTPGLEPRRFKARGVGKLVTVLQLAALFAIVIHPAALRWLVPAVFVVSVVAIVDYTLALARTRRMP